MKYTAHDVPGAKREAPRASAGLFSTLAANCIAQQQAGLFEPDSEEFALA